MFALPKRPFAGTGLADHTNVTINPIIATVDADRATTAHQPASIHNAPATRPPTLPPM
jgi:hypothetical protein